MRRAEEFVEMRVIFLVCEGPNLAAVIQAQEVWWEPTSGHQARFQRARLSHHQHRLLTVIRVDWVVALEVCSVCLGHSSTRFGAHDGSV